MRSGIYFFVYVSIGARCVQALHLHNAEETSTTQCEYFPDKRLVLIVQSNAAYIETGMFANWFHFAREFITDDIQLVVDAPEVRAQELILNDTDLPDPVVIDEHFAFKTRLEMKDSGEVPFGSEAFLAIMLRRPRIVGAFLERHCPVLHVDIDTVWTKDPFLDIANHSNRDLLATDDHCDQETVFCGCFLYFNPARDWTEFMKEWDVLSRTESSNDQTGINAAVKARHDCCVGRHPWNKCPCDDIDVEVLPRSSYPSGCQTNLSDPTIIHANWADGIDAKIRFLDELGLWTMPIPPTSEPYYSHPGPQCGGELFSPPTDLETGLQISPCDPGCTCLTRNEYYSQCMCPKGDLKVLAAFKEAMLAFKEAKQA